MSSIHKREEIIEAHKPLCKYIGAGSKKRFRPDGVPHHGRGRVKYISENTRIRECGKSLFDWCINIGVEPVADWSLLAEDQRPKDGGRCATA